MNETEDEIKNQLVLISRTGRPRHGGGDVSFVSDVLP